MKNFPHQHNQLSKFRATLETIRDLRSAGQDASDDGVLGDELARREIHRFRDLDYSDPSNLQARIEKQIQAEHKKSSSNQGTRTAAREGRKTLRHLGWLEEGDSELSAAGEALLGVPEGSAEELALIRPAVANIAVTDSDGNTSHPTKVLLRLVDQEQFDSHDGMELALEARDDSEAEFERVSKLARLQPEARTKALTKLGATKNKIANAKKILPALAESSGLMIEGGNGRYVLTDAGRHVLKLGPAPSTTTSGGGTRRRRSRGRHRSIVETRDPKKVAQGRRSIAATRRALSSEEQQAAAELLYERTDRHQRLVTATAELCPPAKFSEDPASYDLLVDTGEEAPVDLIEVKTIDGDGHAQIQRSVGQLLDYEYFVVRPAHPAREVVKTVVTDRPVDDELGEFLDDLDIGLVVVADDKATALNKAGAATAKRLLGA